MWIWYPLGWHFVQHVLVGCHNTRIEPHPDSFPQFAFDTFCSALITYPFRFSWYCRCWTFLRVRHFLGAILSTYAWTNIWAWWYIGGQKGMGSANAWYGISKTFNFCYCCRLQFNIERVWQWLMEDGRTDVLDRWSIGSFGTVAGAPYR